MGITLFKRPAVVRKEGTDSEFASTVATLPPGVEEARPVPPSGPRREAGDSLPPDAQLYDSQPFDSRPFDSRPFDSRPFDSQPPDSQLPDSQFHDSQFHDSPDSQPGDSVPPDSQPFAQQPAKPRPAAAGAFERYPAEELPAFLGGQPGASGGAAAAPAIDDSLLPMADQPTIAQVGRYALKRSLGLGGLGQVHEAWDPLLGRTVAIKTLQFESDPRTRNSLDRLFLNEARAVASLSHPNIVTVYDAGLSPQGVYLAMERLQGKDLRQRLAEGWKPGPAVAAQLVRRVADALAYAHARGVVHCDIKPGNIFITGADKPKVLDFGIARVATRRVVPALEGMVAGSPHYLAPEQLLGKEVDARTDVYSLGVVFYELLSGRRAFAGDSIEQITTAVLTNHPAPAHLLRSGIPEALSAIAARAMARDPEARFATASEMAADIRGWFDQPRQLTGARESKESREEARRARQAARKAEPSRWPWALGGASVALLGVLVVGLLLLLRPAGPAPSGGAPLQAAAAPAAGDSTAGAAGAKAGAPGTPAAGPGAQAAPSPPRDGELMMSGGVPVTAAPAGAAVAPLPAGAAAADGAAASRSAGPPAEGATAPERPGAGGGARAPAAARAAAANAAPGGAAARETATVRDAARRTAGAGAAAAGGAAAASGQVQFAISPWGQVEVNGQSVGTTPPLTQLALPAGTHSITIRNADFPPFSTTVQVQSDKPAVVVRHRFGQ